MNIEELKNKVIQGDCLEVMKDIPDKSIDMILCDLPYGTTACKWDEVIPMWRLWDAYCRIIKKNGAIVLFGSQPFTSALVMSNPKMFKYEWVWDKKLPSGFQIAKYRPMQRHENIVVFSNGTPKYNPIMTEQKPRKGGGFKTSSMSSPIKNVDGKLRDYTEKYPQSILEFYKRDKGTIHPTQKPVALFEYLIKTYTNEGDLVLDNCAGSGTTGVACKNTGRNYILIEKEKEYIDIINKRLYAKNS